jgi:hypothetical protein
MLNNPSSGIGSTAEFQSSALPYVTSSTAPAAGSPVRIDLPKVSKFITLLNRDTTPANSISFGFTRSGVVSSSNKFIVPGGQQVTLELRVKEIWVQAEAGTPQYSLCVGLTTIDARMMPLLTGTMPGGSPGSGWVGVG